jgi:hypothetical protein
VFDTQPTETIKKFVVEKLYGIASSVECAKCAYPVVTSLPNN